MRTILRSFLLTVLLVAAGFAPVAAQTTVDSTTLSAAITASQTRFAVASASNVAVGQLIFVDREAMKVNTLSGTTVGVTRGFSGTAARAHGANAIVYVGSPAEFYAEEVTVGSACTATAELYTPRIVLPTGNVYKCTGSQWEAIGAEINAVYVACRALLIADMVDQSCFTADRDYVIVGITFVSKVAESGGTLTIIPRRQQGTEAAASGDSLATAISGVSTVAETVTAFTLTTTSADLILDSGDRLGLDFTDDVAGELAGVTVTFKLIPR